MISRKNDKRIDKIAKRVVKIKKDFARSQTKRNSDFSVMILPSPYEIAEFYGITCRFDNLEKDVPSYIDQKNFTIYISNRYRNDDYAARHLCAHELGHFFLHKRPIAEMNNFRSKEIEEYEANVFSILLMPQIMGGHKWENMEPRVLNDMIYKKIFKKGG